MDFFDGLVKVRAISLDYNLFNASTGWAFPISLRNSLELVQFSCVGCQLKGALPQFLGSLKSLKELKLSYNMITGEIPLSFGESRLQLFWLNNKKGGGGMNGSVNVTVKMICLRQLWLQGNQFSGTIPADIGNLKSLEELKLSGNKFSGIIPESLVRMKLKVLELDNNSFIGAIPQKFEARYVSHDNNSFCESEPRRNDCPSETNINIVRFPLAAVAAAGLLLGMFNATRRRAIRVKKIPFSQIRYGTEDFSQDRFLGSGQFGSVFRCVRGEGFVAVKRLLEEIKRIGFLESKLYDLSLVEHPQLVAIVGFCTHKKERLIVYEFMSGGCLTQHLNRGNAFLSWPMRLTIVRDVASAIQYLHEIGLAHGDIRPANILLDANNRAKLSDLGLLKLVWNIVKQPPGSSEYSAPENIGRKDNISRTQKADVYSFGILMIELLTGSVAGRPPLAEWFRYELQQQNYSTLKAILEPSLLENVDDDGPLWKQVKEFARITEFCIATNPDTRITMDQLLNTYIMNYL